MNTLKNYITGAALMVSAWGMAQLHTIAEKQYPAMYENQTRQLPSPSATPEKITLSAKELVDININTMMSDPVLRNADWGFVVYDPKTKKIVSSYNENSAFIPASTTKLLTTETALSMLGEKFRWTTQLEFSGEVDDAGNLNGNLYVIGSGDPFIGTGKAGSSTYSTISKDFMYALQERGIKKINEKDIEGSLMTAHLPPVDLCIRTGGEKRLSNFLLWQLAYSELYFTNVSWPEFDKEHLKKAINEFSSRDRRYGGLK